MSEAENSGRRPWTAEAGCPAGGRINREARILCGTNADQAAMPIADGVENRLMGVISMPFGPLLTAMVTPMHEDGSINLEETRRLARHLAATGSTGIVVAGTTGESPTLSFDEKVALFAAVREAVDKDIKVVAGTGSYSTTDSIKLTKAAEKTGVDGIMLVVPYYNKPPQYGLYEHFKAVASETALPVMLYNVPGRTGQNLLPETVARLAEDVPNITSIKEASGNVEQVTEVRRLAPDGFVIYSGDDALTLPILSVGGAGVVSVAAHLVGERIRKMIDSFMGGNVAEAMRIHCDLFPLFKALFVTANPIPVKTALNLVGFDAGPLRLPLVEPTDDQLKVLRRVLVEQGLIVEHV